MKLVDANSHSVLFSVDQFVLLCPLHLFLKENLYDYSINSPLSHKPEDYLLTFYSPCITVPGM